MVITQLVPLIIKRQYTFHVMKSFCIARENGSKQRTYRRGERLQPCLTDLGRLKEFEIQWLTIIEDETFFI